MYTNTPTTLLVWCFLHLLSALSVKTHQEEKKSLSIRLLCLSISSLLKSSTHSFLSRRAVNTFELGQKLWQSSIFVKVTLFLQNAFLTWMDVIVNFRFVFHSDFLFICIPWEWDVFSLILTEWQEYVYINLLHLLEDYERRQTSARKLFRW